MADFNWKVDTTVLNNLIAKTPGNVEKIVMETANRILTDARMITPRDPARPPEDLSQPVSGGLRADSDVVKTGPASANVEYYKEYAVWQELGFEAVNGRKVGPRPFLTPAVEKAAKKFEDDLAKVLD